MSTFWEFILFRDPNVSWVLIGMVFMCGGAAIVGTFTFLQKRALIGDAIAHAILPGVCLAFLFTQSKHPLVLLLGAFGSGWLGLITVNYITRKSSIKPDTALGIVLSVFYGIGVLLLTMIQSSGNAAQSGLDKFLFGKAASLVQEDVITFGVFSFLLIGIVIVFYRPIKMVVFDRDFALSTGMPVRKIEGMLSVLTVSAIAIGIQAVGVVLMASLLIAPAVAARYWTHRLSTLLLLAAGFAALAGIIGAYLSYTLPQMPTGPWVVVALSVWAFISILFGSKKGVGLAIWNRQKNKRKMLQENLLKCLYQLGEADQAFTKPRSLKEIQERRFLPTARIRRGVRQLQRTGYLSTPSRDIFELLPKGVREGKRIVRIHRLWELYLTQYLQLPSDHVHENAEAIEHIITPELERQLEKSLARPKTDPHESPIPYDEE